MEANGDTGLIGDRVESCRQPFKVTTNFRLPAWSLCSHNQIPCHVPKLSFPSVIGMVNEDPRKHAFTCAG